MELRPGYKKTEVGLIPEAWNTNSVSGLAQIKTGPFGTLLKASEYSDSEGVPIISVGEIGAGRFKVTEHTPLAPNAVVRRLPQYVLRTGDVVFARKGAVQRSALVTETEDGWFLGSDGIAIRPHDGCHPPYLAAQFQGHALQSWLSQNATGTTMASLNQEILGRVQVPTAPLGEQRSIATALSDVDALITKLDQLIAKKRDIKQAAMQQLLTGKTRLPGFSGEWERRKISDLLVYERPDHYIVESADYNTNGDIPVLTANKSFVLGYTHEKLGVCRDLPAIVFDDFTTDCKYVDFPFKVKSSAIKLLRARGPHINLRYIFLRMQLLRFPLGDHKRYYISEYQGIEVPMPDSSEQYAIVEILTDMATEISTLEVRRDKTHAIKQGMMEVLLTGQVRLPVNPESSESVA